MATSLVMVLRVSVVVTLPPCRLLHEQVLSVRGGWLHLGSVVGGILPTAAGTTAIRVFACVCAIIVHVFPTVRHSQAVFQTEALSLIDWLWVITITSPVFLMDEARKIMRPRHASISSLDGMSVLSSSNTVGITDVSSFAAQSHRHHGLDCWSEVTRLTLPADLHHLRQRQLHHRLTHSIPRRRTATLLLEVSCLSLASRTACSIGSVFVVLQM